MERTRRRQTVDYKRLAGLSEDQYLEDTQDLCCICDKTALSKRTLPSGQPITSFLRDFQALPEFDSNVLCQSCYEVCAAIVRLEKELKSAKDQLNAILSVNREILLHNIRLLVLEPDQDIPGVHNDSVILRLTDEETYRLGLEVKSGVLLPMMSSRMLQKINAKCSLFHGKSLLIQGSEKQSVDKIRGLVCESCDARFSQLNHLMQHLRQSGCSEKEASHDNRPPSSAKENSSSSANNKPFKCVTCYKMFTRKASLMEHCARHKGLRERECKICRKKFYRTSYWRHMSTVHAQNEKLTHHCAVCGRKFAQKYRLLLHEKSHVSYDQREYVCTKCPDEKRFATRNRFKTHEKQVHEAGESKSGASKLCPKCGLIFSSAGSLSAHRKRHHSCGGAMEYLDLLQCHHCFMNFSSSEELQRHSQSDHESRSRSPSHECSWCGLQFTSFTELDAHTQSCQHAVIPSAEIVGHEEIVQPDFDGAEILQESETSNHQTLLTIDDNHSGATLIISEDQAGAAMMLPPDAANSLFIPAYDVPHQTFQYHPSAAHIREDFNEQPLVGGNYSCQPCEKSFTTYKAKSQHERLVHPKGPLHSCTICERIFANNQYLRDHMKVHSDVKPFVCDYEGCGKPFRLGKDLIRHKRVHTGEKPFKCEVCGKCFSASSNLSEHRSLHTGLMPYECAICAKKFRLWSTMRKHANRCPSSKNGNSSSSNMEAPLLSVSNAPTVFVFDVQKGL